MSVLGDILVSIFPHFAAFGLNTETYSVFDPNVGKCGKNADQNNSEYGHFLRSDFNCILPVFYNCVNYKEIIIDNNDNNNNKKVSDVGVSLGLFEVFQNFFFSVWVFLHLKSTNRSASEKREVNFNSSLPLSPASRTLRHYPVDYCRELPLCIASDRT